MLSRIAESLYWIGRYIERAEDTARILDVHFHLMVEDPDVTDSYQSLLRAMGVVEATDVENDITVASEMIHNPGVPGSIANSINAAWDNARGAREVLSSELWECLNVTHTALPQWDRAGAPHELLRSVKERAAIAAGLVDTTMSRDDGWRFLILGRSIERADMTIRILSAQYGAQWGASGWRVLLRCCSAHEAFLRRHRGQFQPGDSLAFLLIDEVFPRSVLASFRQASACIAELDRMPATTGHSGEVYRLLARTAADLSYATANELSAEIEPRLAQLEAVCAETHRAVTHRYFRVTAPIEWIA